MQLSVREVAQYLNVSEKTVYRWISEGKVPHHRVDGQYRFNRSDLLELMATLKLFGMRAAYDEVMATAIKRKMTEPGSAER